MKNFITELMMIYYNYSKWGITLTAAMAQPQPLTEEIARETVRLIILQTLEAGVNPFKEAMWSEAKAEWGKGYIPNVEIGEREPTKREINELTDWVMETTDMQEALRLFSDLDPEDQERQQALQCSIYLATQEEMEEMTLGVFLSNLHLVEHD